MPPALILALFFTVALLAISAYFLMGSVPLLILRHDTPMDSRFVRAFFDNYYKAAAFTAVAGAFSYALAGRPAYAAGGLALGLLAAVLRRLFIPRMDALRARLDLAETSAIPDFRRIHATAILVNLAQLVVTVWSLVAVSIQLK